MHDPMREDVILSKAGLVTVCRLAVPQHNKK
jgi:hypothetical protein